MMDLLYRMFYIRDNLITPFRVMGHFVYIYDVQSQLNPF